MSPAMAMAPLHQLHLQGLDRPQLPMDQSCPAMTIVISTTKNTTRSWCQSITGSSSLKLPRQLQEPLSDKIMDSEGQRPNAITTTTTLATEATARLSRARRSCKAAKTTTMATTAMATETFPSSFLSQGMTSSQPNLNNRVSPISLLPDLRRQPRLRQGHHLS